MKSEDLIKDKADEIIELRNELQLLDQDLLSLFQERQDLANRMHQAKKVVGTPVYSKEVEARKLQALDNSDKDAQRESREFLKTCMRLSRGLQYRLAIKEGAPFALGTLIDVSLQRPLDVKVIATQNQTRSYSSGIAAMLYPSAIQVGSSGMEAACRSVATGEVDVAFLPVQSNSYTGNQMIHLVRRYDLHTVRSVIARIHYGLIVAEGSSMANVKTVISTQEILAQCKGLIGRMGWRTRVMDSTRDAANHLRSSRDKSLLVIAPLDEGYKNGLKLLKEESEEFISDVKHHVRFIVLARRAYTSPKANTIALMVTMQDQVGGISKLFSIFSDYGINICRVITDSYVTLNRKSDIFIEFEATPDNPNIKPLLYQLIHEVQDVYYTGWYEQIRIDERPNFEFL